jgi:polysaccharide export outer membrane protein
MNARPLFAVAASVCFASMAFAQDTTAPALPPVDSITSDAPAATTPVPATGDSAAASTPVATTGSDTRESRLLANDHDYQIGPEDVLDISVWKNPDLSRTVPVRPDGKVSLPLVNDIQAAGLTPSALREELTTRLSEYVPSPEVAVIIREGAPRPSSSSLLSRRASPISRRGTAFS